VVAFIEIVSSRGGIEDEMIGVDRRERNEEKRNFIKAGSSDFTRMSQFNI
jgi:hypothetical protein